MEQKNTIPQSLINVMGGIFKDPAWISCSNRTDGVMAGISPVVATNFTKYDGGSNNTNRHRMDADLMGMDITIIILLGLWPGPVLQQPTFQFSIMMVPVPFPSQLMAALLLTMNGANTGAAKKHDISGLSATAHSVTIQSLGSGVVSILGMWKEQSCAFRRNSLKDGEWRGYRQ